MLFNVWWRRENNLHFRIQDGGKSMEKITFIGRRMNEDGKLLQFSSVNKKMML
jgi:hypothetical protein